MDFEKRFIGEWISLENQPIENRGKTLAILQKELLDIQQNMSVIEEKQRILANLSKLYR